MENIEFVDQLVGGEEPEIIKIPFQHDPRFSLETHGTGAEVYDSETPTRFRLAPEFLDFVDMQPAESWIQYNLRALDEVMQREVYELPVEEQPAAFRRHIRRTYPLYVDLVSQTIFHREKQVILLGKDIKFIHQERIDPHRIYDNFRTPPTPVRRIRHGREALKEIENRLNQVEEQDSQDLNDLVDVRRSPLPGPSRVVGVQTPKRKVYTQSFRNIEGNERSSSFMAAKRKIDFSAFADEEPGTSRQIITATRKLGLSNDEEDAGSSQQFCMQKQTYEFPPLEVNGRAKRPTSLYVDRKIDFDLFDCGLMGVRFDKKHTIDLEKVPEKPTRESVSVADSFLKRFIREKKLKVVGTLGVAHSIFGDGHAYMYVYKLANKFAGHCVMFSLREAQELLPVLLNFLCLGMADLSDFKFEEAMKNVLAAKMARQIQKAEKLEEEAVQQQKRQKKEIKKRKDSLEESGFKNLDPN